MSDESTRLGGDLAVNEATLELLRHRIEAQVRSSLFRSVGLPVGGAGIVAILIGLFVYVPDQLKKQVDGLIAQPGVQRKLEQEVDKGVTACFQDDGAGQQVVRQ